MDSLVLPAELEREIFEIAALLDFHTIPSLLRVAGRVLEWIEPMLYRVVRIGHSSQKDEAYRRVFELKPTVLAKGVQHLFVTDLSHWPEDDSGCGDGRGRLEYLFGDHSAVDLGFPAFRTITHMDIFDEFTDENDEAICAGLSALPHLTHLCLNDTTSLDTIPRIFTQCPRLQLLVLMDADEEIINEIADNPPTADVRFVVSGLGNYSSDWEVGARGGTDFWIAGDEFVARKRRGEIEASRYLLDHFQGYV
ncbi:hypothetical protein MSAN_02441400 [Mycena sanguinolenta]|uniref:Uncharacterized protein n=1 Tax=Mycena sanguinolenta TaxID=230812 RepID=A0A8H7CBY9_9AGAR|nr:hypothetical protein MSAN_02441400 [Mycena sanguinolenta]